MHQAAESFHCPPEILKSSLSYIKEMREEAGDSSVDVFQGQLMS